jgi:hypothetical protein
VRHPRPCTPEEAGEQSIHVGGLDTSGNDERGIGGSIVTGAKSARSLDVIARSEVTELVRPAATSGRVKRFTHPRLKRSHESSLASIELRFDHLALRLELVGGNGVTGAEPGLGYCQQRGGASSGYPTRGSSSGQTQSPRCIRLRLRTRGPLEPCSHWGGDCETRDARQDAPSLLDLEGPHFCLRQRPRRARQSEKRCLLDDHLQPGGQHERAYPNGRFLRGIRVALLMLNGPRRTRAPPVPETIPVDLSSIAGTPRSSVAQSPSLQLENFGCGAACVSATNTRLMARQRYVSPSTREPPAPAPCCSTRSSTCAASASRSSPSTSRRPASSSTT